MNPGADAKHQVMYYCNELHPGPQTWEPAQTAQIIGLTQKNCGQSEPEPEAQDP